MAATELDAQIIDELQRHLSLLVTSPVSTVQWEAIREDKTYPYLETMWFSGKTNTPLLGNTRDFMGIFQVTVVQNAGGEVEKGQGLISGTEIAGQVINHFEPGIQLFASDFVVKIEKWPYIIPSPDRTSEITTAVTIVYRATR